MVSNKDGEVIHLAGGDDVPAYLVTALDELEATWPGASLPQARAAIVLTILKAQKRKAKRKSM